MHARHGQPDNNASTTYDWRGMMHKTKFALNIDNATALPLQLLQTDDD